MGVSIFWHFPQELLSGGRFVSKFPTRGTHAHTHTQVHAERHIVGFDFYATSNILGLRSWVPSSAPRAVTTLVKKELPQETEE